MWDNSRSLSSSKVCIPETVWQELSAIGSEQAWATEMQTASWLEKKSVGDRSLVDLLMLELDSGESEAIALAIEMKADLLLLDERQARKVAYRLGLKFIGLLGVLVEAKQKGFIAAAKPIVDDMIVQAGFWVGASLYNRVLREVGE